MRKPQHAPGIPNIADQGTADVPLPRKQQFVLKFIYIFLNFQKPVVPTTYIKYFFPKQTYARRKAILISKPDLYKSYRSIILSVTLF